MTNESGSVVWKADYLPFGKAIIDPASTITNDFRFPGQTFDSETGYHYNWNRYYDPETGRYLTADPIGIRGGLNLYAYVGGDPVNRIDPKGLKDQFHPDMFEIPEDEYYYVPNYNEGSDECKNCKLLCETQYKDDFYTNFWFDEMEAAGDYCSNTPSPTFCESIPAANFYKADFAAQERKKECLKDCARDECAQTCNPFARD